MVDDVRAFIQYWNDRYASEDLDEQLISVVNSMPPKIKMSIQKLDDVPLLPEPYFGHLHDDTSNDILLLLLNPGEVRQDAHEVNLQTIERFRTWSKGDYLAEEDKIPDDAFKWRDARRREACRIVDDGTNMSDFRFLHTIEYFPFHSKKFDFLNSKSRRWISEWNVTQLMIKAVKQISLESRVCFIFAIGILWTTLLEDYGFEQQSFITLGPKKNSHRIWKYQLRDQPDSLPIVVYVSGAGRIGLPTDGEATSVIRQMIQM